jgi:SAM-dependent methyltransferase
MPVRDDIPSPLDFHDLSQARAWVEDTVARRPARPRFFEAFAAFLDAHFDRPIRLAELGSGPGHLASALLRRCDIAEYAAIDFSPAMHQIARETLGAEAGRVRFLARDFRQSDWSRGLEGLDAVVTMQAAHEVRHKSRLPVLFETVLSTLRPGGAFLFCDHYSEAGSAKNPQLYLARDEQSKALTEAGFHPVRVLHDEAGMTLIAAERP